MKHQNNVEVEVDTMVSIRLRTSERECPRCQAVLVSNEKEECYECLNCGFIDCGGDDLNSSDVSEFFF